MKANYPFPRNEKTQKGNTGEIILSQYLQTTSGLDPLVYKLHYNPNVDQAIKGDDCLLFNEQNLQDRVIVGEAKLVGTPSKQIIDAIISNLEGNKRLPTSIPFVAQHFETAGNSEFAGKLEDLLTEIHNDKVPIINVGFMLSSKADKPPSGDTCHQVEKYGLSQNKNLVFLALGLDNPMEIVEKAFQQAGSLLDSVNDLLLKQVYADKIVEKIEEATNSDDLKQEFSKLKKSENDS